MRTYTTGCVSYYLSHWCIVASCIHRSIWLQTMDMTSRSEQMSSATSTLLSYSCPCSYPRPKQRPRRSSASSTPPHKHIGLASYSLTLLWMVPRGGPTTRTGCTRRARRWVDVRHAVKISIRSSNVHRVTSCFPLSFTECTTIKASSPLLSIRVCHSPCRCHSLWSDVCISLPGIIHTELIRYYKNCFSQIVAVRFCFVAYTCCFT